MISLAWLLLVLFAGGLVPNHSLDLTTRHPIDSATTAPGGVQGGGPS